MTFRTEYSTGAALRPFHRVLRSALPCDKNLYLLT